jgi:hypothetical protein
MSALPPKADIGIQPRNVRFVPKADIGKKHKESTARHPGPGSAYGQWQGCPAVIRERQRVGDVSSES